jgi:signal transduction histidine kinase
MSSKPDRGPRRRAYLFDERRESLALRRIAEIGLLLHGATRLDDVLRAVLVTATARQGAGMNRAYLLLGDEEGRILRGEMAVGPSNAEEANQIWNALHESGPSLTEMAEAYRNSVGRRDVRANELVRRLTVPLDDTADILVQVYRLGTTMVADASSPIPSEAQRVAAVLGVREFAVVPVLARKGSLGVLVADNLITRRAFSKRGVELLELLACQAGLAIENARLQETLAQKVDELGRAYEALREEQEKLVRAERLSAVGEMAVRVAHEVRNPLVSIGGFTRRLLVEMPEKDPRSEYLRIIRDEVARLEQIVGGVLDYVRPPVSAVGMTDINAVVRTSLDLLSTQCDQAEVKVSLCCDETVPFIAADEARLRQAVLNLCRNAIQAMPDGGRLEVSTLPDRDWVLIRIEDTGVGIASDQIERIFAPFYTTRSQGTGLGLAITSQVVEAHGGRVEAESERGVGSRFTIRLPLKEQVS